MCAGILSHAIGRYHASTRRRLPGGSAQRLPLWRSLGNTPGTRAGVCVRGRAGVCMHARASMHACTSSHRLLCGIAAELDPLCGVWHLRTCSARWAQSAQVSAAAGATHMQGVMLAGRCWGLVERRVLLPLVLPFTLWAAAAGACARACHECDITRAHTQTHICPS